MSNVSLSIADENQQLTIHSVLFDKEEMKDVVSLRSYLASFAYILADIPHSEGFSAPFLYERGLFDKIIDAFPVCVSQKKKILSTL